MFICFSTRVASWKFFPLISSQKKFLSPTATWLKELLMRHIKSSLFWSLNFPHFLCWNHFWLRNLPLSHHQLKSECYVTRKRSPEENVDKFRSPADAGSWNSRSKWSHEEKTLITLQHICVVFFLILLSSFKCLQYN